MKVKNTKSFMQFYNQIGIYDVFSKNPSNKFSNHKRNVFPKNKISPFLKIDKKKKLSDLKNKISKIPCSLKETSTNLVFSNGNPESDVMVIGDVPGKEEDRTGKPFVGNSGKLIRLMLDCIDLNENNCYFSNLIFWRPPGNRSPNSEEIEICLPYTKIHIDIIKPKLLILLGGLTAKAILNTSKNITELVKLESFYQYSEKKIKTLVIFHPSFLINNPIEKKRTWFALSEISRTIKNE